jgi:hypothetical protein
MKLLSTLTQISVNPAAGTGNVGGELRLFFTTLNHADCHVPPPDPFYWIPNSPAVDTYTLPTGEVISLNLNLDTEGAPGNLFIIGTVAGSVPGGFSQPPPPMGQSITPYLPGSPVTNTQRGGFQDDGGGVHKDIGFELTVPWDGISADCHGRWWVNWH